MTDPNTASAASTDSQTTAAGSSPRVEDIESPVRHPDPLVLNTINGIAFLWACFQLWIASPFPYDLGIGIITGVPARSLHLSFGLLLCFLLFPAFKGRFDHRVPVHDIVLALVGFFCASYLFFNYEGLVNRTGILLTYDIALFGYEFVFPIEAIIGGIGIILLLEATRRCIGLPLVIVASLFLIYSVFGQSMPDLIAHKGVSLNRLIGYQWLGGEAIFGIPIDVSTSFVFLFVLFGALLDRAGAGQYFLGMAFALVGMFRGGPAKAAILASGMTGMISGSSIANVVTTGTFTIPVMRRIGLPAVKAGAIEVSASTNGQLMPPIMGAAAFIIAEFIGISYFEVIVAATIPAVLSYIALLYISHLEALKLGLQGLPRSEIPPLWKTFLSGVHFLIPIIILLYFLMVERWTASSSVFWAIIAMMAIMVIQRTLRVVTDREANRGLLSGLGEGLMLVYHGMVAGARNMVNIAIAVGAAGIIVGAVSSTGLNNAMVGIIETLAGGNVYILLILTAVLCIVLGMGLPTTANYIVVASLLAGVLVELGNAAGLVLPLIAVHLYVFYFGLLADSTPPVCLAAFAASAISRADPLKTGVQSFLYDIRTAVLPLVFIFNPELLLIGVESVWHGLMVFVVSLLAILAFSSLTQGWMFVKLRWYESLVLIVVIIGLFRPDFLMDQVYPEYQPVDMKAWVNGDVSFEEDRVVRFHVTRESNYGDRQRLFAMRAPSSGGGAEDFQQDMGLTLVPEEDGDRYKVDVGFMSKAEEMGFDPWSDYVTRMSVRNLDRPAREWVYPLMLMLLGLVVAGQWRRRQAAGLAG